MCILIVPRSLLVHTYVHFSSFYTQQVHNGGGRGVSSIENVTGKGDKQWVSKTEGEGEGDLWSLSLPLVKAVHDLEALTSSVQLSSSLAIISQEGTSLQQHILKVLP